MAIVRYCILLDATKVCTDVFYWDNANTYTPMSGYIIAGDNTGEVGWSYAAGTASGGTWVYLSEGPSAGEPGPDPIPIEGGGTGADTAEGACINLGALNVVTPAQIQTGYTVASFWNGSTTAGSSFTPNPDNGNYQFINNTGAFTLIAPAMGGFDYAMDLLVINGAGAGSITAGSAQGWTIGSSTGSPLTTTNGHKFLISIRCINSISTYSIYALQ